MTKKIVKSIRELEVGKTYKHGDLYALCDYFMQEGNMIIGWVTGISCFRGEFAKKDYDEWTIKEIFD